MEWYSEKRERGGREREKKKSFKAGPRRQQRATAARKSQPALQRREGDLPDKRQAVAKYPERGYIWGTQP